METVITARAAAPPSEKKNNEREASPQKASGSSQKTKSNLGPTAAQEKRVQGKSDKKMQKKNKKEKMVFQEREI